MTDFTSFQTQRQIQSLLAAAGLRPQKRHGQHFLIDRNLMMRLIDAAGLSRDDTVLEVGTGTGSLTALLSEKAGLVHTFEIDPRIAGVAAAQLASATNVTIQCTDALQSKSVLSPELVAVLNQPRAAVKLVANLPYDVATPLLTELLLVARPPRQMCFTIQREVGDRLRAAPGTRAYGPAAIVCQHYARIERLASVPPSCFWPRPKVESIMMRMTPNVQENVDVAARSRFVGLVRGAFTLRRKTLAHILSALFGTDGGELLRDVDVHSSARPESLTPIQWQRLTEVVEQRGLAI